MSAFLLDRFARDRREGRRVCMLEKATGTPRQVSPRDAAVRKHFYSLDVEGGGRDSVVEDVLSTVEGVAAPTIEGLEAGDLPWREARAELALYLALCWMRTPFWRNQMASIMEQTTSAMVAESYRLDPEAAQRAFANSEFDLTPEEVEEFRVEFVEGFESGRLGVEMSKNAMIGYLLEGIQRAAWVLFVLDWTVVRLEGGDEFILADNPVSIYDPEPAFPGGGIGVLSSPHTQIFMPIGPRTGIFVESNAKVWEWARENLGGLFAMTAEEAAEAVGPMEGSWAEGTPTGEMVDDLNLRSYATSERFIFGNQARLQAVHAMRTMHGRRLREVAPRGPRLHIVEEDAASPTGLRITRTFKP